MRHLIAHEIHHIGQLSIWSREMGIEPVSASLIDFLGLFWALLVKKRNDLDCETTKYVKTALYIERVLQFALPVLYVNRNSTGS